MHLLEVDLSQSWLSGEEMFHRRLNECNIRRMNARCLSVTSLAVEAFVGMKLFVHGQSNWKHFACGTNQQMIKDGRKAQSAAH